MIFTVWIMVALVIIGIILSLFFLIPFFFGAPYEPSRGKALKNIVEFTDSEEGDKIADLGSGDGRICIELAKKAPKKKDIEIHGFEMNPLLVLFSRYKIRKQGLRHKIKIKLKNFWFQDLSEYNKVVIFQFNTIIKKLGNKIKREMKSGSRVVSHWWKIPGWKIKKKVGRVYLYEI